MIFTRDWNPLRCSDVTGNICYHRIENEKIDRYGVYRSYVSVDLSCEKVFSVVVIPFQYGNGFHMRCMREQVKWKDCNRMVLMLEIVEILTKRGRGA